MKMYIYGFICSKGITIQCHKVISIIDRIIFAVQQLRWRYEAAENSEFCMENEMISASSKKSL